MTDPLYLLAMYPVFEGDKGDRRVTGRNIRRQHTVSNSASYVWARQGASTNMSRASIAMPRASAAMPRADLRLNSRENLPKKRLFTFVSGTMAAAKSCHPPVTLVTLGKRVLPLCLSAFCHPDTLKRIFLLCARARRVKLFQPLVPRMYL